MQQTCMIRMLSVSACMQELKYAGQAVTVRVPHSDPTLAELADAIANVTGVGEA